MHFAGFTAHQKSPYLENGGMIFRAAPHLPTENTDDVTGQSFTMAASSTRGTVAKLGKPVPPAAECDAITSSFA
jgi:hypothetical protein